MLGCLDGLAKVAIGPFHTRGAEQMTQEVFP